MIRLPLESLSGCLKAYRLAGYEALRETAALLFDSGKESVKIGARQFSVFRSARNRFGLDCLARGELGQRGLPAGTEDRDQS